MEDFSLLRDFALIMVVAGVATVVLRKLRLPPVLGYLLAGLLLSPYFVPFYSVADTHSIGLLADIGLVLLLFGVGLEFGWNKIRQIGIAALIIGGIEIATMISLGYGLGRLLGWSEIDSLFLGAALHASSSAIIFKVLRDLGKLSLVSSRLAVGILVVEDFAAVIIISLLSGIHSPGIASFGNLPSLVLKLVIFGMVSLILGAIFVPRIIAFTHRFNSRETLLVVSLGLCFAMALISKELGLSVATGAFLMGALVGDTGQSEDVIEVMSPVRDMFAALFFVAIGMLIDITRFSEFLIPAVIVAAVFIAGKVVSNTIAAVINGYTARDSIRVGMSMPQMGEFSLAVAKVGTDQGVLTAPLYPVIAVATTLTSVVYPFLTRYADAAGEFLGRKSPQFLREYMSHLNEWAQASRKSFPVRSEEARKLQRKARTILINFLILVVIITVGTFALQNVEVLVEHFPLRRDIIALLMGSLILALCLPSVFLIWRTLRSIIDDATRQAISQTDINRTWRGERFRGVLRHSINVILAILIFLWMIPLITQFIFIGSSALALPAIILAFALYLVIRSIRGVQRQMDRTCRQVFLGEEEASASAEDLLTADHPALVKRLGYSYRRFLVRSHLSRLFRRKAAGNTVNERKEPKSTIKQG